ncbi:uncharacterized protein LDX57_008325 [Aspergillus melleus]|uniref:uncharacterized protein n=1 Tax=Aspergillus melleus TaxID=138277 RepID=UPI001E8E8154|nr:uncharacterized protein LDX57_008325 [Aspergillus melleus]KAH8430663.1 hypothetical protein LDX57_008325 [Aspergillus melleus]
MLFKFTIVALALIGQCLASAIHNIDQQQTLLANGDVGALGCTDAGRENPNCSMANEEAAPSEEAEETVVEHYEITVEKTVDVQTQPSIEVDGGNKCVVAGFAPFCEGKCPDGYKEKAKGRCLGPGPCCLSGSKALCCTD